MDVSLLQASSVLRTTRALEPAYANRIPSIHAKWLPFAGSFEFVQAAFALNGIYLSMAKRWPNVTDGVVTGAQTMLAVSMTDPEALVVNGKKVDGPGIAMGRGGSQYRSAEGAPWTSAIVMFPTLMHDRGWPDTGPLHSVVPVARESLNALRATLSDLFQIASLRPERFASWDAVNGMVESLHGAFDQAFRTSTAAETPSLTVKHFRIARQVDEFIAAHAQRPIYSDEIADALGVTSRTLHTVMQTFNGMSLHRYMRLRRLWMARNALMNAQPSTLVKTVALDHGFWHLGRFSNEYFRQFGETPSQTLSSGRSP